MLSGQHSNKMKKREFKKKLNELLRTNFKEDLKIETLRLLASGGVDLERFEDSDYGIVKTILAVALKNVAESHYPYPFDDYKRIAKNLERF